MRMLVLMSVFISTLSCCSVRDSHPPFIWAWDENMEAVELSRDTSTQYPTNYDNDAGKDCGN